MSFRVKTFVLRKRLKNQTNCHPYASFCHNITLGTRLFAKKIKSDAK